VVWRLRLILLRDEQRQQQQQQQQQEVRVLPDTTINKSRRIIRLPRPLLRMRQRDSLLTPLSPVAVNDARLLPEEPKLLERRIEEALQIPVLEEEEPRNNTSLVTVVVQPAIIQPKVDARDDASDDDLVSIPLMMSRPSVSSFLPLLVEPVEIEATAADDGEEEGVEVMFHQELSRPPPSTPIREEPIRQTVSAI
jgi:hypothetical protein